MREGEEFRWSTSFGQTADVHERVESYFKARRISIDRGSITGRAALEVTLSMSRMSSPTRTTRGVRRNASAVTVRQSECRCSGSKPLLA